MKQWWYVNVQYIHRTAPWPLLSLSLSLSLSLLIMKNLDLIRWVLTPSHRPSNLSTHRYKSVNVRVIRTEEREEREEREKREKGSVHYSCIEFSRFVCSELVILCLLLFDRADRYINFEKKSKEKKRKGRSPNGSCVWFHGGSLSFSAPPPCYVHNDFLVDQFIFRQTHTRLLFVLGAQCKRSSFICENCILKIWTNHTKRARVTNCVFI